MSAGGARRGRRDNGLDAADYAVAGDVDPRVGEHLLDVLAAGGIAAYLQPSADLNPILRTTTLPGPAHRPALRRPHPPRHGPRASGQADRRRSARPRRPPSRDDPHRPGTVDAEWAKIVAGFHTPADPTAPPWPAAEGVDPTRAPAAADRPAGNEPPPAGRHAAVGRRLLRHLAQPPPHRPHEPSLLDGLDTFGSGLRRRADDDDERYTPPPPPPLPRISKYAVAGVLGHRARLRAVPVPVAAADRPRDYVTLIGFTAIVAGAVTLVWRLRSGDDDDDFDDGAVV